jgi:hypothetical protein
MSLFTPEEMLEGPDCRTSDAWRKSSFSHTTGNCVEVARLAGKVVGVRDSKNPQGGVLRFTRAEWGAFLGDVRNGRFER